MKMFMNILKIIRQNVINILWQHYCQFTPEMQRIQHCLPIPTHATEALDHVALVDLPGPRTGIAVLCALFESIGYTPRGKGYLPDKQNDFLWMAEQTADQQSLAESLPQIVIGDFRLAQLPKTISNIIIKYANQAPPIPLALIEKYIQFLKKRAATSYVYQTGIPRLMIVLKHHLLHRKWPLPTQLEFESIQAHNPLLAWVLVYGAQPNHFAIAIHHFSAFKDFMTFKNYIETQQITLNQEGEGPIKGGFSQGIAQASTIGTTHHLALQEGHITLPTNFIEFVWRYPEPRHCLPKKWGDYFRGFVAAQANHVIESLYDKP